MTSVSLETRSEGWLLDRSDGFEDAFLNWQPSDGLQLRLGQFCPLNQVDVSRRLTVSEPIIFSTGLLGDFSAECRIDSLRAFSPRVIRRS